MSSLYDDEAVDADRRRRQRESRVTKGRIPYRALSYYIGHEVRVFARGNPLLSHPAIYEGRLAGVFEDPAAIILEDAHTLILDRVPMEDHYHIVKKERIGAIFIRIDEIRHFEILTESEI